MPALPLEGLAPCIVQVPSARSVAQLTFDRSASSCWRWPPGPSPTWGASPVFPNTVKPSAPQLFDLQSGLRAEWRVRLHISLTCNQGRLQCINNAFVQTTQKAVFIFCCCHRVVFVLVWTEGGRGEGGRGGTERERGLCWTRSICLAGLVVWGGGGAWPP